MEKSLALTPPVEEGPYYKIGSPELKHIARPGTVGTKLTLTGRVFNAAGKPVARAWLDFWQADGEGNYDNEGFNLRGHQFTDKNGRYRLMTVRPYLYLSRAPHIHVKVRAAESSPVLTTQLFFPGESRNKTDSLVEPLTMMEVTNVVGGQEATFDFVVES
jgi:protocatechuate 3,4-dioxygenase beta subunit